MARREFTKPIKRQALKRSGGFCEAVGEWYGLKPGQRCNANLSYGVQFDHIDLDANSKDNSLGNCAAVCLRCHDHKTRTRDIPVASKTLRQQDKALGIKKQSRGWSSRFKQKLDGTVIDTRTGEIVKEGRRA
ncbi:HNH endonuclease signature motif containing protein [Nitratireductor sp. GCM10026969]|uniref:HNH endonuclease signature motif containing protein n=1 Tax=Nitratireductor sp. GCM10026969 TaxID=3252645 RepID=UPI00361FE9B5